MRRALLPLVTALAMVAACTLLYNPDRLSGLETPDGDLGRGIIDAAIDPDGPASDGGPATDATRNDAALVDAAQRDASVDAARVDAAIRDAAVDARQPDAPPPNCGGTNEQCCAGPNPCEPWNECTGGACRECGDLLESCCDPGASCRFGVCLLGICT